MLWGPVPQQTCGNILSIILCSARLVIRATAEQINRFIHTRYAHTYTQGGLTPRTNMQWEEKMEPHPLSPSTAHTRSRPPNPNSTWAIGERSIFELYPQVLQASFHHKPSPFYARTHDHTFTCCVPTSSEGQHTWNTAHLMDHSTSAKCQHLQASQVSNK